MSEDWRAQMKRLERQRAEGEAQYKLRSAEAGKRWAEADRRWASLGQRIRSLLTIAQTRERQFEERKADEKLRKTNKANIERETCYDWLEAGKRTDERLRVLLNLVEHQSRHGHKHKRAED